MSAVFGPVALTAHPAGPTGPLRSLAASGTLGTGGQLALEFDLHGDLLQLRLADPARQPARRDELWRHTCLECFAAPPGQPGYLEFNFSAAGDWAAYRFADYRAARSDLAATAVNIGAQILDPDHLRVSVHASVGAHFDAGWRLSVAAVIEDIHGGLSYWAAHHPRPQPDFHDRDGFRIAPRTTGTQNA